MRLRSIGLTCSALIGFSAIIPVSAITVYGSPPFPEIVLSAHVIVVVTVQEVVMDAAGRRVARAHVEDTWKGNPGEFISYDITHWNACQLDNAIVGERVVLFLEQRPNGQLMRIVRQGGGRFPIIKLKRRAVVVTGMSTPKDMKVVSTPHLPDFGSTGVRSSVLRRYVLDLLAGDNRGAA